MKVAVLGAGVVGVATAYYLAEDGHEVTLIERGDKAALETSYGNAGLYSPSDAYAWASPDALRMAIKSLYRSDLGIKYKLRLDPRLWLWSLKFLTQCTHKAAYRNTLLKLRLLRYSQECLNRTVAATGIDYDGLSRGILYYFRSAEGLKAAGRHMGILRDQGLELEIVDRDRMLELEPVMANAPEVAGAIHSPNCQTGDSYKFANRLAEWCAANKGAMLSYGTRIERLIVEGGRVTKALTDRGEVKADAFVLAAGAESVFMASGIGINLPMSPFGDRLRAASSAVFTGYDYTYRPKDFVAILETVRHLFGDAVDYDAAEYWAGLRPMTPTSVPIMGPSRYANLFLNVGHGHVGWSMSCGAGRFVADWVSSKPTEIDGQGYLAA
jgi:D-amino-acid dehydrogenase